MVKTYKPVLTSQDMALILSALFDKAAMDAALMENCSMLKGNPYSKLAKERQALIDLYESLVFFQTQEAARQRRREKEAKASG